jgi:phosphoribosylformimino-5-aminoimidazole carboxamide ribotide isomerase
MIIIPAIDLHNGACVRLSQGDLRRATVYSDKPADVARRWEDAGARRLHIVDLDGAMSGAPANLNAIQHIRDAVSMTIELGGGIRTPEAVQRCRDLGIDYVILGTAAIRDPAFLRECCARHAGTIIVGIDAREGMAAVQGWTETTRVRAIDFARSLDPAAIAAIIYTDISRDGMLSGPNISATADMARSLSIPVIASGGVACMDDIKRLLAVESSGIMGVITGRALYTGDLDLAACIRLARTAGGDT